MNCKDQITHKVASVLLTLALLFPVAIQFIHSLDEHEHTFCTEVSTHLHEKKLDCSLCDFHFSVVTFNTPTLPDFIISESFPKLVTIYEASENNTIHHHYYLRGPPQLS
ncbi:hypothetical protein [Ulvibacter litoralis]|uniref:Uncharacterized protein n=1 Tax=Ulvibacter litoralis TaxID=227084 RepID=A0A1G7F9S0_9FLAO|nr:hypothetical protein [Ulvibacter litoralis]GHC52080.1 hypothetical protein GCM10008083_14780 [Ulvibacter litoralis]SDE72649.1 hypothetical protein SAMN05421855_102425 [Ulvibacter litoralis]